MNPVHAHPSYFFSYCQPIWVILTEMFFWFPSERAFRSLNRRF
jgi:hypothetical protein